MLRAEEGFLLLFHSRGPASVERIPKESYPSLLQFLSGKGDTPDALLQARIEGAEDWLLRHRQDALREMERSTTAISPQNAYQAPLLVNLELTTRCPLRCPQCYCDLNSGKDLDLDTALAVIEEAARLKIPQINLSGGESMVYPHLYRLIRACRDEGIHSAVALSGYGLNERSLEELIEAGVGELYVSLNGSTEEVSAVTRDGYALALNALALLQRRGFANWAINWVAHRSNVNDFANMVRLCRAYDVPKLVVIGFKPDAAHSLFGALSPEDARYLKGEIRRFQKEGNPPQILVEPCYSPMRAYTSQRFFTNLNQGMGKGCGAGRDGISVNVDGEFTPCRHLELAETFPSIVAYWRESETLEALRHVEERTGEPCLSCRFEPYCLGCLAVSHKLRGEIRRACRECVLPAADG